jgi:hypothetical protein
MHGMRKTFETWAESTGRNPFDADAALQHGKAKRMGKVSGKYAKHEYHTERKAMLAEWADYTMSATVHQPPQWGLAPTTPPLLGLGLPPPGQRLSGPTRDLLRGLLPDDGIGHEATFTNSSYPASQGAWNDRLLGRMVAWPMDRAS